MKAASVREIERYWIKYGECIHDSIHVDDISEYEEGQIFQEGNKKYIIAYAVDNDVHFINPFFERTQYRVVRRIVYE